MGEDKTTLIHKLARMKEKLAKAESDASQKEFEVRGDIEELEAERDDLEDRMNKAVRMDKKINEDVVQILDHKIPESCDPGECYISPRDLAWRVVAAEDERNRVWEALDCLVKLKAYKEVSGKDAFYRKQQPLAWAQARDAIEGRKKKKHEKPE